MSFSKTKTETDGMNKNGTKKKHHFMRLLAGLPLGVLYLLSDITYPLLY